MELSVSYITVNFQMEGTRIHLLSFINKKIITKTIDHSVKISKIICNNV